MGLIDLLKLPQAKDVTAYDDRELSLLHKEILSHKGFMKKVYARWYRDLMLHVPDAQSGAIVELGSGPGTGTSVNPTPEIQLRGAPSRRFAARKGVSACRDRSGRGGRP